MRMNKKKIVSAALGGYLCLMGLSVFAGEPAKSGLPAPKPGSCADTLTAEDKRMAYLVCQLLGPDGKIDGADIERGRRLFLKNCQACHGDDGMRTNLSGDFFHPVYLGKRAVEDMPTFWYQMNFGDSIRGMTAYYNELELQDMVDIAGFAQTLPDK